MTNDQYAAKYKAGEFRLPVGRFEEQDFLERMRYYWGMYCSNGCGIGFGGKVNSSTRRSFKELRDYARGLQPIEKFQDELGAREKKGKNKGKLLWNISWQPIPILPKFRNILIEKIESLFLNFNTQAIDELAHNERLTMKNEMKLRRQPEMQQFMTATGFRSEDKDMQGEYLDSSDDVEFYFRMGGIMLPTEIMMKDGVDATLYHSDYNAIKQMFIQDVIDLNTYAAECTTINGREIIRYVDPARLIIRSSIFQDYRDTDFRGYSEHLKISELRQQSDFDEKELAEIARRYTGKLGNSHNWRSEGVREDYAHRNSGTHNNYYDDFGVEVMTMYFIDTQVNRFVTGFHKNGSRVFEPVEHDFQLSKRASKDREIEEVPIQKMYKCRWVVDTDYIFDHGEVDVMVRDGERGSKQLKFPLTVYSLHEPSLIERCIAFDDEIQLYNYRIRRMLSTLPPAPRMVLDKSRLRDGVSIGDEKYSLIEMIDRYQNTGILVIESLEEYGMPGFENDNTAKSPFTFVPSGIAEDINILMMQINSSIDKIRQVTGINEIADGTSQKTDMLKSVMQGLTAATNAAIRPNIMIYVNGYEQLLKYVALKWQMRVMNDDYNLGQLPIAGGIIKLVKLTKKLLDYDWNIQIEVDSAEDRQMILQELFARREMLLPEHFMTIYNVIKNGDLKKAQLLITRYEKQAREQQHQKTLEIQQATSQANAQAAQVAEQAKASTLAMEAQSKQALEQLKAQLGEQKAMRDHERAKELKTIENEQSLVKEVAVVRENNQNRLEQ